MNVGVLGRGEVGRRLARAFGDRGHAVMLGTRDPSNDELQSWLATDGAGVTVGSLAETAELGELLVPAVDVGGIDASRELESLCILWVRLGFKRGAWDHGFKLLVG